MKKTLIIKINGKESDSELNALLTEPSKIIANGGTVAFPTETVYGLGANALSDEAVNRIYIAKGRPSDNPLIVHIASIDALSELVSDIKPYVPTLMRALWPGPITFVFNKRPEVSSKVSGGLDTIAVRMPAHKIAIELIKLSKKPIAAPSANLSGKPSPTSGHAVIEDLDGRVDCIIVGEQSEVGLESTVLDVTGDTPVILRPGKITKEQIIELVGNCVMDEAIKGDKIDASGIAKSPGMKYKHYAPEADVEVFMGSSSNLVRSLYEKTKQILKMPGTKVGIMTFQEEALVINNMLKGQPDYNGRYEVIKVGSAKDQFEYAGMLFENLRIFDSMKCTHILARGVEENGIGVAIMNRLKKASDGKVTRI
ncbi:L-threonylcarbamoyladenylate synthase [Fusibacter bizertensis]